MKFFKKILEIFSPPKIQDPDFGEILFMSFSESLESSYWESEWNFPPTGDNVSISIPGNESGPHQKAREWYLALPGKYEEVLSQVAPILAKVFQEWLDEELPEDIFSVVKLAGFGVENLDQQPIEWDVSFETIGERKWLGITIPFVGDTPQDAVVDS